MPAGITWTNRTQITDINRNSDLTITWSGGSSDQMVVIVGGTNDEANKKSGAFYCLAPATAGSFTVPAAVLAAVPPTPAGAAGLDASSSLTVGSMQLSNLPWFTAPGLNAGSVILGSLYSKTVNFR